MSERKIAEEIDAEISELISRKIAAEDADSGWLVAYAAMRVLPVLRDIEVRLGVIAHVLGRDMGFVGRGDREIAEDLERMADLVKERSGR
jgi:hypothetical protein